MKFRNYDKYEVYEDGRIWSYSHKKWLKPSTLQNGYQIVCLYDNEGKKKSYRLNRVIYESVSGEPIPEGYDVNHINEDKTDNRFFENLNLMTRKENVNWGTRNSRAAKSNTNNQKRSKQVCAFDKNGELVLTFPSISECGRQGFDKGNVAKCCRNCYMREGNNIYKGYIWRYI